MNIRVRVCKACLQSSLKSLSQLSRRRILLVAILSSFPDVQMSIPSGTSVMTAIIQPTRFPSTLVYPLLSWFSYWPWELCLGTSTTTRNHRTGRLMLSSPPMKSSRRFKFKRFFFWVMKCNVRTPVLSSHTECACCTTPGGCHAFTGLHPTKEAGWGWC